MNTTNKLVFRLKAMPLVLLALCGFYSPISAANSCEAPKTIKEKGLKKPSNAYETTSVSQQQTEDSHTIEYEVVRPKIAKSTIRIHYTEEHFYQSNGKIASQLQRFPEGTLLSISCRDNRVNEISLLNDNANSEPLFTNYSNDPTTDKPLYQQSTSLKAKLFYSNDPSTQYIYNQEKQIIARITKTEQTYYYYHDNKLVGIWRTNPLKTQNLLKKLNQPAKFYGAIDERFLYNDDKLIAILKYSTPFPFVQHRDNDMLEPSFKEAKNYDAINILKVNSDQNGMPYKITDQNQKVQWQAFFSFDYQLLKSEGTYDFDYEYFFNPKAK